MGMFTSFAEYFRWREWYGGEPGAESMASDQADQYGSPVRTTAMQQYGDSDKPPTAADASKYVEKGLKSRKKRLKIK